MAEPPPVYFQNRKDYVYVAGRDFYDPESGLAGAYVTLYHIDGSLVAERSVWNSSAVSPYMPTGLFVNLVHSETYYLSWRQDNYVNLTTLVNTTWLTIDETRPVVVYVQEGVGPDTPSVIEDGDMAYVGSTSFSLRIFFQAFDPESHIAQVQACLGTYGEACDAVPYSQLEHDGTEGVLSVSNLTDWIEYFAVIKVTNGARLRKDMRSNGFRVDMSPPSCGTTLDGIVVCRASPPARSCNAMHHLCELCLS